MSFKPSSQNTPSLAHELKTSLQLVLEAGALALIKVAKGFNIERKVADGSPVTDVDHALNHFLTEELKNHFPDDRVIGEESQSPDLSLSVSARTWYLDPIDGTKDLIRGNGEWSIILGLCEDQKPKLGIVFQPTTKKLWYAVNGGGAFTVENAKLDSPIKIQVNKKKIITESTLICSKSHPDGKSSRLAKFLGITQSYSHGSVGIKIAHIAEGKADLYFNFSGRCHHWDLAGVHVILQEAGGEIYSLNTSNTITYSPTQLLITEPFAASAAPLSQEIVQEHKNFSKG